MRGRRRLSGDDGKLSVFTSKKRKIYICVVTIFCIGRNMISLNVMWIVNLDVNAFRPTTMHSKYIGCTGQ